MERIRVAALQYFIRPVETFGQFRAQVEGLVETAADYRCNLMVFPEYFTVQLLTLENVKRPIDELIRRLAKQVPQYLEVMGGLARKHRIYIVAGSIPVMEDSNGTVYNDSFFLAIIYLTRPLF